jgi:drug/metabolite transporter (DMT)-like permease
MPPVALSGLLLVLAASLAWSGLDLLRKLLVGTIRPTPLLLLLSVGQLPLFVAWTAVSGGPALSRGYWAPALGSVAVNLVANLLFLEAVRVSPFSLTIPFLSLTPVFTTAVAAPFLGEVPTLLQVAGVLLVVAGAFRLNLAPEEGVTLASMWRAFRRERGSVLMTGVALLWSLAPLFDKLAMTRAAPAFHGAVLNAGVALGVAVVLLVERRAGEVRQVARAPWTFLLSLVFCGLALGLQLLAIQRVWIGLVETIKRGVGSTLALIVGGLLFHEVVTAGRVLAIGLMVAGVALILL